MQKIAEGVSGGDWGGDATALQMKLSADFLKRILRGRNKRSREIAHAQENSER